MPTPTHRPPLSSALVIGNCQAHGIAECLKALDPGLRTQSIAATQANRELLLEAVDAADLVFMQPPFPGQALEAELREIGKSRAILYPTIVFPAFHPDCVLVGDAQGFLPSPSGRYHSALVLHGLPCRAHARTDAEAVQRRELREAGLLRAMG